MKKIVVLMVCLVLTGCAHQMVQPPSKMHLMDLPSEYGKYILDPELRVYEVDGEYSIYAKYNGHTEEVDTVQELNHCPSGRSGKIIGTTKDGRTFTIFVTGGKISSIEWKRED